MCVIVEVYVYSFRCEELDMLRVCWSGCLGQLRLLEAGREYCLEYCEVRFSVDEPKN